MVVNVVNNVNVYGIIYKILNKHNGNVYIGQTTQKKGFNGRYNNKGVGIERVYKHYLYNLNSNRNYNEHLFRAIEQYGFEAFEITYILDIAKNKLELDEKEQYWIKYYNSFKNGYNNTSGGESCEQKRGAENKRSKPILQYDLEGNLIKRWDCAVDISKKFNVTRSNIHCCCVGKTNMAVGFIWKYEDDFKGITKIPPYINNKNEEQKIAIIKLNLDGEYIKEWDSMHDVMYELGFDVRGVSSCCTGNIKSCNGFMWMKRDDYYNFENILPWKINNDHMKRPIVQLSLKGEFIKEWETIRLAGENIADSYKFGANIRACCIGKQKTAYGYRWMYKEDYYENQNNINPLIRIHDSKPKVIIQLDLNGRFIKEWNSLTEADKGTGIPFKNISACCRKKRQTAGGFKWMYYDEYIKQQELNKAV